MSQISPSQVQHPAITVLRTLAQICLSLISASIAFVLILSAIAPEILAALEGILSPETYAWLAGFFGSVVAIAGALTRIFSIRSVNEWLRKIGLGVPDVPLSEESGELTEG